jgi:hypothetical protein
MPISYTIQEGDSVIALSDKYGLLADTIWNDGANSALREKRPDMNVLMPGDVVVIPDKRPRMEKRPTAAQHKFKRKGIPALFRLQVYNMHIPRANQSYTLTVDGGKYTGTTDGQGIVQQFLPATCKSGQLVIGDDNFTIRLQFGHLDPISELSGVQKRLKNLGYDCGAPDGKMNDATRSALLRFQRENGLTESGQADDDTKNMLDSIHNDPYAYPDPSGAA